MPIRSCRQCGKDFQKTNRCQRHCSAQCFAAQAAKAGALNLKHRATYSPARRRAMALTHAALDRGELKRQPCEVCGIKSFIVAHHDDYAKPLEIRWLCRHHHGKHHHKFGPGKNAFLPVAENA